MTDRSRAPRFTPTGATILILVAVVLLLSAALTFVLIWRPTVANLASLAPGSTSVPLAIPSTDAISDSAGDHPPPGRNGSTPDNLPAPRYTRAVADYPLPDVRLRDVTGKEVAVTDELHHDGPVIMQFIFTTCPTICPVMSATFGTARMELGADADRVRMVSISIDPEHDTPDRLRAYSRRYQSESQWHFLTGTRAAIASVQKAFDAYQENKMRHAPLTFLRASPRHSWVRLEGMLSATQLLSELARTQEARSKVPMQSAATNGEDDRPLCVVPATGSDDVATANAELGRRIYHDGILSSGAPLRGLAMGDVVLTGSQANCATCHRRSGFSGGEETVFVPPVTGPVLYKERELRRGDLFRKLFQDTQPKATSARVRDGRYRPAYTDLTLAAAIRHGTDPTGRRLHSLMPHYQLNDQDMGHLVAYLKSLFDTRVPGVEEGTIHFATVVTDRAARDKCAAMLEVMDAYIRRKNADTQGKLLRPGFSPLYKDEFRGAFRKWQLHVWELHGPPAGWKDQLANYYRSQPVFALLSGMSGGSWSAVHDFCERMKLPCLFPHVDLPVVTGNNEYSLYFSRGLTVEGEALARHLQDDRSPNHHAQRIVQVYRDGEQGRVPANALRSALRDSTIHNVKDHVIDGDKPLPVDFWVKLVRVEQPTVLVVWLVDQDLDGLTTDAVENVQQIFLSRSLLSAIPWIESSNLVDKIHMTYQFTLPENEVPRKYRVRAWMRSRRIELTHEPIQLNTFFALSIADHALVHLVENFSRDYLIEAIEHETENSLNPGIFPHLSLGPGQRFASKGSYIVKLPARMNGELQPVSDWIVP